MVVYLPCELTLKRLGRRWWAYDVRSRLGSHVITGLCNLFVHLVLCLGIIGPWPVCPVV